jgi:hypothetical protein
MRLIHECLSELIHLGGGVPKSVIVGDIVEEFLGIQGSSQKQGQIPICGVDDVGDHINCFGSAKGILVREVILRSITNCDFLPKATSYTR